MFVSLIMVYTICIVPAFAEIDDTYFVTYEGIELTKEQYDNLIRGFDEYTIYTMPSDTLDEFKNDKTLYCSTETFYFRNETVYEDNEIIEQREIEISEQLYNKISDIPTEITPNYSASCGKNEYETSYKKLKITITGGASVTYKTITLTNTWKQIPACKSYDVLAIRPVQTSLEFPNLSSDTHYGTQNHDGVIIRYGEDSSDFKICDSNKYAKSGIGLSQNIVDNVSTTLINSMTVKLVSGASPYEVYGSYQHATSNVTLSKSQDYTISVLGMGSVILFDDDVAGYYDDMTGVYGEFLDAYA